MSIIEYAKHKLEFWLGLDVRYSIPEQVTNEDFLFEEVDGHRYLTIRKAVSIAQKIVYPEQRKQDIWHDNAMKRLITSVEKMFSKDGHFSICLVNDAISSFDLNTTPSVDKAKEALRTIHCMDFSEMTPEVFAAIPSYMTHIFTEGRVPLEEVVLEDELDTSPAKPDHSNDSELVMELSDLVNDALAALAMGKATPEMLETLRARQRQALDKRLGEDTSPKKHMA